MPFGLLNLSLYKPVCSRHAALVSFILNARGTPRRQARLKKQAAVYAGVLKACLANAGVCKSFETWGFTDKHSWINAKGEGNLSPLPFDVNYNKKPAYTALLAALQDKNSHSSL